MPDIRPKEKRDFDNFCTAVSKGDLDSVRRLVEEDHSLVTRKDGKGCSALHHLSEPYLDRSTEGKENIVAFLIDKKADVNATNIKGCTPLHFAAFYHNPSDVRVLFKHGARVKFVSHTPLHACCDDAIISSSTRGSEQRRCIIETVKALLDVGVDKAAKNDSGKTAYVIVQETLRRSLKRAEEVEFRAELLAWLNPEVDATILTKPAGYGRGVDACGGAAAE